MSEEQVAPADTRPRVKRVKRDVHGWCILDKPVGMTSTHAVSVVKRLYAAKRAGHAGTLDPLASGLLPIALGEATKTVPFVMDGRKTYRFTVRWGEERDTDDSEGRATANSDARPTPERFARCCPASPAPSSRSRRATPPSRSTASAPTTSRARARPWNSRPARSTSIGSTLVETPDADHSRARRRMRQGHLCAGDRARPRPRARLLRPRVGAAAHRRRIRSRKRTRSSLRTCRRRRRPKAKPAIERQAALTALLQPVDAGLRSLPSLGVSRADAARLARGQPVLLRGRDAPIMQGFVAVSTHGDLIALAEFEQGELRPRRIFNLGSRLKSGAEAEILLVFSMLNASRQAIRP